MEDKDKFPLTTLKFSFNLTIKAFRSVHWERNQRVKFTLELLLWGIPVPNLAGVNV